MPGLSGRPHWQALPSWAPARLLTSAAHPDLVGTVRPAITLQPDGWHQSRGLEQYGPVTRKWMWPWSRGASPQLLASWCILDSSESNR